MESILVAGAGLGGMITSLVLQRKAFKVKLFEALPELPVLQGGGLLTHNALQALAELGLLNTFLEMGHPLARHEILDMAGKPIHSRETEATRAAFGMQDLVAVYWPEVIQYLHSQLGGVQVQCGKRLQDIQQRGEQVEIRFEDGTSATGMALIAADGIGSTARRILGEMSEPKPTGYRYVSGLCAEPATLNSGTLLEIWGTRGRFIITPVGNNRVAWTAILTQKAGEMRQKPSLLAELKDTFRGYPDLVTQVLALTAEDKLLASELAEVDAPRQFTFGRVSLLGDAVHGIPWVHPQAVAQTLESAAILANALDHVFDLRNGLMRYEEKRMPRLAVVKSMAMRDLSQAQTESMPLAWFRNTRLRLLNRHHQVEALKPLYDVDLG